MQFFGVYYLRIPESREWKAPISKMSRLGDPRIKIERSTKFLIKFFGDFWSQKSTKPILEIYGVNFPN